MTPDLEMFFCLASSIARPSPVRRWEHRVGLALSIRAPRGLAPGPGAGQEPRPKLPPHVTPGFSPRRLVKCLSIRPAVLRYTLAPLLQFFSIHRHVRALWIGLFFCSRTLWLIRIPVAANVCSLVTRFSTDHLGERGHISAGGPYELLHAARTLDLCLRALAWYHLDRLVLLASLLALPWAFKRISQWGDSGPLRKQCRTFQILLVGGIALSGLCTIARWYISNEILENMPSGHMSSRLAATESGITWLGFVAGIILDGLCYAFFSSLLLLHLREMPSDRSWLGTNTLLIFKPLIFLFSIYSVVFIGLAYSLAFVVPAEAYAAGWPVVHVILETVIAAAVFLLSLIIAMERVAIPGALRSMLRFFRAAGGEACGLFVVTLVISAAAGEGLKSANREYEFMDDIWMKETIFLIRLFLSLAVAGAVARLLLHTRVAWAASPAPSNPPGP